MTATVFDSSALLALIQNERGAEKVRSLVSECIMGSVNFAEVVSTMNHDGYEADQIEQILGEYNISVIPFDQVQATAAGNMRRSTRHLGLSLGDRACLALALQKKLPVLTADRAWAGVDVGVRIELVR
jgi:ribonuclease VapC